MLTATVATVTAFFYPVGNTPAKSLTKSIPPKTPADILLLGCGDVRDILFTSHVNSRTMDITCCDNQKAVIARNILLFTLVQDDTEGVNTNLLWSIYYEMYLDCKARDLLRSQAKKLLSLSNTMDAWHQSQYAQLRICDSATLEDVRVMWKLYATEAEGKEAARLISRWKSALKEGKDVKKEVIGTDFNVYTAIRSMLPVGAQQHQILASLHNHYWEHGTLDLGAKGKNLAKNQNPTFLAPDATLHYGTDPFLGFHLSLALMPMARGTSTLADELAGMSERDRLVTSVRSQFRQWTMSYRKQAANITVRFFVGDAIPFAHTLQNKRITGASSAHWYRHQGRFGPLVLDGPDYGAPPNGPLTFDVIDTSNLADHLGGLNLLAATTPLLRHSPSSTLYTETLLRSGRKDQGEIVDDMLCGHVSTISALLDLFPAEYWTNTSDISHSDEQAFQSAMTAISFDVKPLQLLVRLSWKRPLYSAEGMTANSRAIASNMKPLHFTGTELASVLFTVFLRMFRGEDMTYLCSGLSAQKMSSSGAVPHHRASFVAFLRLVKTRVATDWHATMHALSELVRQRQGAPMNSNYFWELDTWMHLLHVHSVEMLAEWHNRHMPDPAHTKMFQPITSQVSLSGTRQGDLRDWVDMPPVVCVTLKVPRNKINVLISCKGWRTPSIACDLRGPGLSWLNISPACHFGFGRVSTTGMAHDNSYSVLVQEDSDGWRGSADLIVSFFAPSYWLQMAPRKATVGLRICPSPVSIAVFRNKLGLELKLYQTTLEDSARVFVTRYAPHQQAHPALPAFSPRELSSSGDLDTRAETKITAQVSEGGVINSLTARFDINLAEHKSALLGGCLVTTTRDSPCRVSISLGERYPAVLTACFPVFTVEASQKLRIARKTGYIELQCRVGDCHSWIESPLFMYPVWPPKERGHAPVVWNLPYLDLSRCPTLDTHKKKHGDLGWFNPHISSAFSWRERAMRENPALPCTAGERIRLDFKDSLFSILTQYTGLQGFQGAVFALSKPDGGGVHIMIVCAATRIDLSSRAVTLDCAVLPLRAHLIPRMQAFILGAERRGTIVVKVSREELHLWKTVLPACVERCRTWDHGAGCEYGAAASVPRTLADGEAFLCSCGHGRFPPGFLTDEAVPHWSSVERYAVRAALSPAFWAPFADRAYVPDLGPGLAEVKTRAKTKAGSVARPIYTGSDGAVNTTDGACAHCKQTAPDLKACGKCRSVKYCGATCQKEHWKQHKQVCKA